MEKIALLLVGIPAASTARLNLVGFANAPVFRLETLVEHVAWRLGRGCNHR